MVMGRAARFRDGAVRPIAFPAGKGMIGETLFENRFQDPRQRMMHDPVTKRRGRYESQLWLVHNETTIGTGMISTADEFMLETHDFIFLIEEKSRDIRL